MFSENYHWIIVVQAKTPPPRVLADQAYSWGQALGYARRNIPFGVHQKLRSRPGSVA